VTIVTSLRPHDDDQTAGKMADSDVAKLSVVAASVRELQVRHREDRGGVGEIQPPLGERSIPFPRIEGQPCRFNVYTINCRVKPRSAEAA
jgi:hypothetical protein